MRDLLGLSLSPCQLSEVRKYSAERSFALTKKNSFLLKQYTSPHGLRFQTRSSAKRVSLNAPAHRRSELGRRCGLEERRTEPG